MGFTSHTFIEAAMQQLEDQTVVRFEKNSRTYRVDAGSLKKMIAMGLAQLPIESIALLEIPETAQEEPDVLFSNEPEELDISNRLTEFFPGYFVAALYELQSLLKRSNFKAYVIGGIVRDLLIYQERRLDLMDVDITVEGSASDCCRFIVANSRNFTMVEEFPEFGTAKLQYKESIAFDIASTRTEIYAKCGALPTVVERGVPLAQDIIRRDFSLNTLALSIHELGKLLDHMGGVADIENRLIRVLHPASFFEDPSRILRVLKFAARLDFNISSATFQLLNMFLAHGASVYRGGGERIKQEMRSLFRAPETPAKRNILLTFLDLQGIRLINMDLTISEDTTQFLKNTFIRASDRLPDVLALLTPKDPKKFLWEIYLSLMGLAIEESDFLESANRLVLSKAERDLVEKCREITKMNALDSIQEQSSPVDIYEVFNPHQTASIAAAILLEEDPQRYATLINALQTYIRKWKDVRLELNGKDLIELGLPEGEQIGIVLEQLLHHKLLGRLEDQLAEVHFVKKLIAEITDDDYSESEKTELHQSNDLPLDEAIKRVSQD
ncbi:MAG: hypothetical protein KTR14_02745 [Vampirovibrio sp.]|nr:hypothetical protein [Vampirovibrio sp.]